MRRKLSLLISFVGVLGLIGFTPVAQATHSGTTSHEDVPVSPGVSEPDGGVCTVIGTVDVGPTGVGAQTAAHNHFNFQDTTITCEDVPGGDDMSRYAGAYEVRATGATDGPPDADGAGGHGENTSEGWSHSSCYEDRSCPTDLHGDKGGFDDVYDGINDAVCTSNCGEIAVDHEGNKDALTVPDSEGDNDGVGPDSESWVKFHRQESVVEAWGALVLTNDAKTKQAAAVCFNAVLDFTPDNVDATTGNLTGAVLSGEAFVWEVGDKGDCAGAKGGTK